MAKYLDKEGLQTLWAKVKEQDSKVIKENVTDKLGVASGIATLGSDSKLTASQLPALKTINNESIVGSGNISIDLNVYQLVEGSLPEAATANPNKIYLLLSSTAGAQDKYTEYAVVNGEWEKFGEYKADVDLTPYVKKDDLEELGKGKGFVTFDDVVQEDKNGLVPKEQCKIINKTFENKGSGQKLYVANDLFVMHNGDDNLQVCVAGVGTMSGSLSGGMIGTTSSNYRTIPIATNSKCGLISSTQFTKLENIAENSTSDSALSESEILEVLV